MFNLTRYFSTLSFIFIVIAGSALGVLFGDSGIRFNVIAVLVLLFLFQLFVVRRAQDILSQQSRKLEETNRDLDQRVQARTQELESEVEVRRNTEARLEHLAHHDPLTGLPNRLLFVEQLRHSIAVAARHKRRLAVLFIDLDRFKEINDSLGHAVGDDLLVAVAHRLAGHLRESDGLSRLGGDEFVCVIDDVKNVGDAGIVADKLIALLSHAFVVLEHELYVSASIGICLYPDDGADVGTLVRNADTAMYEAKASGRSCSYYYSPEMTVYARERRRIEGLLRRAIEQNELEVHYQIKVSADGRPSSAEALLRWNSAELGPVSPVRFIPLAEESGFIVMLGEWVLRQVCHQIVAWRREGLPIPRVAVNLSVKQIERIDVVALTNAVLAESGLEPDGLELEITESAIMNVDNALAILEDLNKLGVHMAIDDFGTGYSSLAYLKQLPINTLKIDRAFVIGIGASEDDEAIIRTIVALAHSLSLTTVAEGVDSEAQLEYLRKLGCDEIQGYLFSKPQPAAEFVETWKRLSGQ